MEIEDEKSVATPNDIWLGELERTPGFLLRIAQISAYENLFRHLPELPLRLSEHTILRAVQENPGIQQGTLADVLKITHSLMTRLIRGLEERALLAREVPQNNRRAVQLRLTPAGEQLVDDYRVRFRQADREALSMLSSREQRQLIALLRKVAGWKPLDEEQP